MSELPARNEEGSVQYDTLLSGGQAVRALFVDGDPQRILAFLFHASI